MYLGQNERRLIESAMIAFHAKTCVRFVPRTAEKNFINISKAFPKYKHN